LSKLIRVLNIFSKSLPAGRLFLLQFVFVLLCGDFAVRAKSLFFDGLIDEVSVVMIDQLCAAQEAIFVFFEILFAIIEIFEINFSNGLA